jgi:hypothetical protein
MRRLALAMALTVSVVPALAQSMDDLVEARAGALSCWQRVYDTPHLQSHPDQQVTQMTFGVGYQPPDDDIADQEGLYLFGMAASLRNGSDGTTSGSCFSEDGEMRCGVDCDGGGVSLSKRSDGKLLVDLETYGRIWLESECGGGSGAVSFELEAGLDDKLFLLSPVAAKLCKSLVPTW